MSVEPPEGAPIAEAGAPTPLEASARTDEAPRTVRMVPRPAAGSAAGAPSRKLSQTGLPAVTAEMIAASTPPSPADIPPPGRMPRLTAPGADPALASGTDGVPTERHPAVSVDVGSPPEIQRFLSPLPPAPSAEPSSSPGSEPTARRRSRRTVKIPTDTVPQQAAPVVAAAPAPPPPATPAVVAPPPPLFPLPPPPAAVPPAAPTLQVVPPMPPVPSLPSGRAPPAIPRPVPRTAGAAPPPSDEAPKTVPDVVAAPPPPPPDEAYEVIRPMRIISIGTEPPPMLAVEAAPPAPSIEAPPDDGGRRPSRPPMLASPELEGFMAPPPPPAPPPKPPAVEEVEAIAEDEPAAVSPRARPDEIESIPDDELVPDRISDISTDLVAAHDDIPIDVVLDAPAPKKPPPPPPKRAATSVEPPPLSATQQTPPSASPPPPPTRGVEALAALPSPPVTPAPAAPAAAPALPPAVAAAAAAAPAGVNAQTVNLSSRKRVKPWWEEIFSDDYLRTMEKVEPKAIRKECDFIEDRLGLEKGAVMLDLACGPGAHAVELASRGYNVVGYDLSLAMLARAQDEAQDRGQKINFLQGDMREMAFEEAFDGIYSWSTSFGYFDDEKNVNVLSRMHRALRQGGMLLLDVANRDYICPRQPSLVWFEGDGCVCMDEMFVDFFSSRLRVKRTVMFEDGRARECDYAIRIYGLHELGKMLHDTGFKVVEVTGHPAHPGVFFGSESPRIIVLAERA